METSYRKDFPIFTNRPSRLIYLDNASMTQIPSQVLDGMNNHYTTSNANPLRGFHTLSELALENYELSREEVRKFINAKFPEEIVFTSGATESLNTIAYSYGLENLKQDDEVCVSIQEHSSSVLPWQEVCRRTGAKMTYLYCTKETGEITQKEIDTKINGNTKVVVCTHISNVLGTRNPVEEICRKAHSVGAVAVIDASQSVPHMPVDVQKIDCDFLAFSGHKMCSPSGIGVMYGRKSLLEKMHPVKQGGGMVDLIHPDWSEADWTEPPYRFEAGTVNVAGAIALRESIRYIKSAVGYDYIQEYDRLLSNILIDGLSRLPHIRLLCPYNNETHGIVSFTVDGVHPHDASTILNTEGMAVRAGNQCAQLLGDYLGLPACIRASTYFYNTEQDVWKFIASVSRLRRLYGYLI